MFAWCRCPTLIFAPRHFTKSSMCSQTIVNKYLIVYCSQPRSLVYNKKTKVLRWVALSRGTAQTQCRSTGSSHMWCDIFHSPSACFRRMFKNMPLCDALVVLPFCTVVHATSSVPHTYAISPSPSILCGVTTSFVIRVGGASGGNQYSFSPFCPTRGVSPCGGSNTQSSVKRVRTPSVFPLSQAFFVLTVHALNLCYIFRGQAACGRLDHGTKQQQHDHRYDCADFHGASSKRLLFWTPCTRFRHRLCICSSKRCSRLPKVCDNILELCEPRSSIVSSAILVGAKRLLAERNR